MNLFNIFHNVNSSRLSLARKLDLNTIINTRFSHVNSGEVWESVVGLEVHAQITSNSKLFSGSETKFSSPVNSNVSAFDAALPGTLPVLNRRCVEAGVLTALALSCQVNAVSMFDRKHYFYADLPAGYQITQQRAPLASNGVLNFQVYMPGVHKKAYKKQSRIKQLQLEQDSGKSLHDDVAQRSLVDLNRAGIPLMELVFEPDLTDGEEAAALVKELTIILKRLGTCSCKMDEGALRIDANVSVHHKGDPLGQRTEIKNIGSVRGVAAAIKHEIQRQKMLLKKGQTIINETRSWDPDRKITVSMRDKEEKQDYRYMPEPNLPPLYLNVPGSGLASQSFVDVGRLLSSLPELPDVTRQELVSTYNLTQEYASILVNEDILLNYFNKMMSGNNRNAKICANVLIMELLTLLHKNKISLQECVLTSDYLGELVDLIESRHINLTTAREVLQQSFDGNPKSPKEIVFENNWKQIISENEITTVCEEAIKRNQKLVKLYLSGNPKVFNAIVGDISKTTKGRIDMAAVVIKLKKLVHKNSETK